ncbi:alpha/beta hydrolase [Frankia sp. CNm7]|uniref:Alpha/beta hydrolase n=1 Tax=Frankia nepalensis TaxID=1836974 RepID=A0A937UWC3_9ACTN|nr:alpha/beta hydrolase [Frankia nepalensis]MBL7497612.1 alpha/beta hydrolase [Frankia nepalensis]MBL7511798.1 alpha/beta hydrolase [Frankia nepalensis]MBL7520120.1 alpha/beta hydrolase [Frankia nepalensis]MBL7633256.1 alpha/beta hydrolase [Frankia nepalensis]
MSDVAELRQYALVHARSQGIGPDVYGPVLDGVDNDSDGAEGSWALAWSRAAADAERRGELLDAVRLYNLARFPYVDGPVRREAHARSVAAFDAWRRAGTDIQSLELDLPGGRVRAWGAGLSATERRPLVILMGGIVSTKESHAPALAEADVLGMAGIATEIPGIGENGLAYGPDSWRLLPDLLDAVADQADVANTYALTLSFSGHLALRAAAADPRIRGVVTTGAPVHDFFTDADWLAQVPRITLDTLAHLTGAKVADLPAHLRDWVIPDEELAGLDIPVAYAASLRDEIIPPGDLARLRRHLRRLEVLEKDDVHGSPAHVAEVRLWTILTVLRQRGVTGPVVDGLTAAVEAARTKEH